jgi:hypothetical protein
MTSPTKVRHYFLNQIGQQSVNTELCWCRIFSLLTMKFSQPHQSPQKKNNGLSTCKQIMHLRISNPEIHEGARSDTSDG